MAEVAFEVRKLADLNPMPGNPRSITEYEKSLLREELHDLGMVGNLVVGRHTDNIIGGNQRYSILMEEGLEEVLCAVVDVPPEEEMKLCIGLNNIRGEWDQDKLKDLLADLIDMPNFESTGFTMLEANEILEGEDLVFAEDYSTKSDGIEKVKFRFGDFEFGFKKEAVEPVLQNIEKKGGADFIRKVVSHGN